MEEKRKKKNTKIIILECVLGALIILLIGVTYAYFSARGVSTEQTVTTGNISIVYTENNNTNLTLKDISPINNEDIFTKAKVTEFNVENNGTLDTYLTFNLINVDIPKELENSNFKWALYETDSNYSESSQTKVVGGSFSSADETKYLTSNIKLSSGETKYYDFYIWIEETNKDQNAMKNKTFKAQLEIIGNTEEKTTLSQTILKKHTVKENTPDFLKVAVSQEQYDLLEETKEEYGVQMYSTVKANSTPNENGLFKNQDDDGDTYYFRGAIKDNYVKIKGLTWKTDDVRYIVGTNSPYNFKYQYQTEQEAINDCNTYNSTDYKYETVEACISDIQLSGHKAGDEMVFKIVRINGDGTVRLILDDKIATTTYSDNNDFNGYTYDNTKTCNVNSPCDGTEGTSNNIKVVIDNWYNEHFTSHDNIVAQSLFCNDTSTVYYSDSIVNYGAYNRFYSSTSISTPQYKCDDTNLNYGGTYKLKAGLLTADEAVFAGAKYRVMNTSYFLSFGYDYHLGTPLYSNLRTNVVYNQEYLGLNSTFASSEFNIVPVINVKADSIVTSGNGSKATPYIIER